MAVTNAEFKVLDAVRQLSPQIAERAVEIEQLRRLPSDLISSLREAGAFRMMVPPEYGGEGSHLLEVVRVLEEVARADGSAGWTVMIGADFPVILAKFPRDTVEKIYAAGPDTVPRGAFAPKGQVTEVEGGYRVSGQWPLASGSYDFEWVVAGCMVPPPEGAPSGDPRAAVRLALVPASEAEFLDTWHSVGLRSTLSQDFVLNDVFVPYEHMAPFTGPPTIETDYLLYKMSTALGPTHCGVVLGIAQGALDDLAEIARSKRPAFAPGKVVAEDPVFAHRYGQLAVRLQALRDLTEGQVLRMWQAAEVGRPLAPAEALPAYVAYVHVEGVDIVNEAFSLAGSNAVYETSSLQRRWRDIRVVAQHVAASTAAYGTTGNLLIHGAATSHAGARS